MSDAPHRIWLTDAEIYGRDKLPEQWANPEKGKLSNPYILATPAALAEAPEVTKLMERAILDAQLRCLERGRIDTPDEIRAKAAALRGKGE